MVDIGIKRVPQQTALLKALNRMPGLYELDVSENKGVKLDAILVASRDKLTNLQTFQFADIKNMGQFSCNPIIRTEDNGLELLKRLDLDSSFNFPENVQFLVKSTALCNVSYLNLSNCSISPVAIKSIFDSHLMNELEYLGLANCDLGNDALPTLSLNLERK